MKMDFAKKDYRASKERSLIEETLWIWAFTGSLYWCIFQFITTF